MDKTFFFKVWDIYQNYWGKENQDILKKKHSANLLVRQFNKSSKMKALFTMRNLLTLLWDMNMFIHDNELLDAVRDMSNALLEEDWEYDNSNIDPYTRMVNGIHTLKQTCYLSNEEREWRNIQNPTVYMTNPNIYNVSAILTLP